MSEDETIQEGIQEDADEFTDESVDELEISSYHTLPFKYTFLNKITEKQILIEANAVDVIKHIPIWTKQRILEERHINDIVEYQSRYYKVKKTFNFIGIFYICGIKNRDYRIIDGQHRLSAINILAKRYPDAQFNIVLWVIDVENEENRIETFQNINLARSISFTDFLLDDESQIINKTSEHFYNKYRNFFSDTQLLHPKRPNMKLDNFKNELLHEEVVEKLGVGKADELINYIEKYNSYLSTQHFDIFPKKNKSNNEKLFNLATKKGKLYLGMYPNFEWIEKMMETALFSKNSAAKIQEKEQPVSTEIFNKKSVITVQKPDFSKKEDTDELKQVQEEIKKLMKETTSRVETVPEKKKSKPEKKQVEEDSEESEKDEKQDKNKKRFVILKE